MSTDRRSGLDRREGRDRRSGGDRRAGGDRRSGDDRRSGRDRRRGRRIRKRIPCEIYVQGQWHSALVLDVSPGGLFVQTGRSLAPGSEVELRLRLPGRSETTELHTTVARSLRAPSALVAVAKGGLGLQIRGAPNAYYEWMAEISPEDVAAGPAPAAPPPQPPPSRPRFRVRAQLRGSPRSRTLTVEASSVEDATSHAQRQLGAEWRVVKVEPV